MASRGVSRVRTIAGVLIACGVGFGGWGRASDLAAEETNEPVIRVSGLAFGDLYTVASHHTADDDGAAGAVLRRGYLTFDAGFGKRWYGRLRFELNQSGDLESYGFDADFKDAYAGLNLGRQHLLFGLSPTPTFDLIESIWGFRYLVRTPLDLQGVASRDTGLSVAGPLNAAGTLRYRAMVGAGLNFGHESGDGWKWMGALAWQPRPRWTVDLYADYERLPGPTDRTTLQGFVGYRAEGLRWGIQYSNQDRQEDPPLELASAFVVRRLGPRTSIVGRVDRLFQPSPKGDDIAYLPFEPTARATFLVGGLELRLARRFVMTPNTVVIAYDRNDTGFRPPTDFYLRVTFFLELD